MSFPRYPAYKDSGVAWLGRVPVHWNVKRLKRNMQLLTEKTDRRDYPVALENIEGWTGRFITTETEFQGEGIAFEPDDILFGKLRPYLAKAYRADFSGEAVGDFHVMRPIAGIDSRFAQYQILNREFIAIVDGSTFGSKMPRASWEFVGDMLVTTPPLPEQSQIAAFLDRETAKIDALVAEQRRLMELLKEKRQAVISHAVTRGLNPDASMKPSGIEWLGDVPEHWESACLSRVASRIVVGIAEAATHAYADSGIPILRSTNIRAGRIRGEILFIDPAFASERGTKLIHAGDLVTVRTGNAGVTAVVPLDFDGCQCFTMLITTLNENALADFYCYWMNSVAAQCYFSLEGWGTAQVNISVPILKSLPIPIPPTAEQREIINFLDREVAKFDTLTAEAQIVIDLLQERRTALISAAVTGKIDVRQISTSKVSA
jgi:type I restriction enzyme S subunit